MARGPLLVALAVALVTLIAVGVAGYLELSPGTENGPETTSTNAGSFTYTPNAPVRIDTVWAEVGRLPNGTQEVTFYVTFENDGDVPVYAIGGYVNAMSSTITENSGVLRVSPALICPGAIRIVTLDKGQNATVYAPDCSTGFNYYLVHAGSVGVQLSFGWTTNGNQSIPYSNSTMINADFSFG